MTNTNNENVLAKRKRKRFEKEMESGDMAEMLDNQADQLKKLKKDNDVHANEGDNEDEERKIILPTHEHYIPMDDENTNEEESEDVQQPQGIKGEALQSIKKKKLHSKKLTLSDVLDSSDDEEDVKKEEYQSSDSESETVHKEQIKKKLTKKKGQSEQEDSIENKALLRSLENEAAMHHYADMGEQQLMNKEADATETLNKQKMRKWNRVVNHQEKLRQFPVQYGKQVHKSIAIAQVKKDEMLDEFNKVLSDTRKSIEEKQEKLAHDAIDLEPNTNEISKEDKIKRAQDAAKRRRQLAQQQKNFSRIKKIKSKVYRKRLRRREKAIADKQGDLHNMDDDELAEEMEKRQREFLKERISLKHKNASSWMRRQMRYNEHDSNEAAELQRQLSFNRSLVDKQKDDLLKYQNKDRELVSTLTDGKAEDRQAALENLRESMREEAVEENTGVMAMKFMRDARAKKQHAIDEIIDQMIDEDEEQENENDEEVPMEDDNEEVQGARRAYKAAPLRMEDHVDEDEEDEDESNEKKPIRIQPQSVQFQDNVIAIAKVDEDKVEKPKIPVLRRRKKVSNPKAAKAKAPANPWLEVVEDERKSDRTTNVDDNVAIQLPGGKQKALKQEEMSDSDSDSSGSSSDSEDEVSENEIFQQSIKRSAFSKDNINLQFDAMKSAAIDDEAKIPDIESKSLPGWGDWVGAGENYAKAMETRKTKIESAHEKIRQEAAAERMDADLDNVIIRASGVTVDDKYRKKLTAKTMRDGFMKTAISKMNDAKMAMPLGPEWNTYSSFKRSNLTDIQLRRGKVVEPLNFERSQQLFRAAADMDDFTTQPDQRQKKHQKKKLGPMKSLS